MTGRLGQTRSPTIAELLKAAVDQGLADTHVALPGLVVKYNAGTQRADVKPTVQLPYINDDGSEGVDVLPVIPEVPVLWPRAGGFFMHLPLAVGDTVLLLICERSIDEWNLTTGKVDTNPKDFRKHDLSDAIAIPGLATVPSALKEILSGAAVFGKEKGAQVRAKTSTVEIVTKGAIAAVGGFVAMANLLVTAFNTHVHTSAAPGSPTTTPTVPWVAATIQSTNLKAD